jgi:hypothetical protein
MRIDLRDANTFYQAGKLANTKSINNEEQLHYYDWSLTEVNKAVTTISSLYMSRPSKVSGYRVNQVQKKSWVAHSRGSYLTLAYVRYPLSWCNSPASRGHTSVSQYDFCTPHILMCWKLHPSPHFQKWLYLKALKASDKTELVLGTSGSHL